MNVALPAESCRGGPKRWGGLGACCPLRQSGGCSPQVGALQQFPHAQLRAWRVLATPLADGECWRAAALAGATAAAPGVCPARRLGAEGSAEPDQQFASREGHAGMGASRAVGCSSCRGPRSDPPPDPGGSLLLPEARLGRGQAVPTTGAGAVSQLPVSPGCWACGLAGCQAAHPG